MISDEFVATAYLASAMLFVLSLGGLSSQESARRGNIFGAVGMAGALFFTLFSSHIDGFSWIAPAILLGAAIGATLASRVEMTAMPQLVAILHSFVGLAAVLVGVSSYLSPIEHSVGVEQMIHLVEIYIGVGIGAITFTGSIIAWAKLRGSLKGTPLLLPGRHAMNLFMLVACVVMLFPFLKALGATGLIWLLLMTALTLILGVHLVMAIGGADMPVVVSLLNSYSGWAAAAAGFMLGNDLLIVTGALVGSSGAILSKIMCDAMNRSIWSVVFGGFGASSGTTPAASTEEQGEVTAIEADGVAELCKDADSIMIVPGYGMAVAQAQATVNEFTSLMRKQGKNVRFAIHPVAGRLPGHMNVLLAEAGVPYDIVFEMDEVNEDLPETDVVLVIGANDIVNPGAETDESSPIYGMPVIQAWKAGTVVVFKRSMGSGYAGVQNPLFFHENTRMCFGDAKASMRGVLGSL